MESIKSSSSSSPEPQQGQQEEESTTTKSKTPVSLKIKCSSCEETLDRQFFPKKKFEKKHSHHNHKGEDGHNNNNNNSSSPRRVCRSCTKKATAQRLKQQTLAKNNNVKYGRRAESGIKRRPNNFGYCNYVDKLFSMSCFTDIVMLGVFKSAKDVSESMAALQAATKHGTLSSLSSSSKDHPNKKYTTQSSNQQGGNQDNELQQEQPKVLCLCIGDGCTPRTAVLASFLTKRWDCISIDPELHDVWTGDTKEEKNVQGLTGYKGTLEEFIREPQLVPLQNSTTTTAESAQASNKTNISNGVMPHSSTSTLPLLAWDHLVLLCVHSHARFRYEASIDKIRMKYGNIPTSIVSLPCCPKFKHVHDIGRKPDIQYEDDCVFSMCRTVEVWNFWKGGTEKEETNTPTHSFEYCLPVNKTTASG